MEEKNSFARARVLLVDDHVDGSQSLVRLLSIYGANVLWTDDPHEAVRLAEEFQPDLILLDICMPGMSGFEVLRQLRSRPAKRSIKVFALTGRADIETEARCVDTGFDGFLAKPVEPETFKMLLDLYRLNRTPGVEHACFN